MTQEGRLIIFEGIDGAGTTTQMARLLQHLRQRDVPVHATSQPSGGPVGRLLRALLSGAAAPVAPEALALLFAADRRDHLAREILPHLRAGVHVLCDRYVLSSLAYQTVHGAPRDLVAAANAGVRAPDLTLFLDVPADVAARRRAVRAGQPEMYEIDAVQRAVSDTYRAEVRRLQAAGAAVGVVDASGSLEEVEAEVRRRVSSCLGL
jgi:dTMP kinase